MKNLNIRLIGIPLIAVVLNLSASAENSNTGICPSCRTTARLVLQSNLSEARSDYYLGKARASAIADEEEREGFLEETLEEFLEATAESKEQYQARLDLCALLNECYYEPEIEPENFLSPEEIAANPNPYWPLIPGTTLVYESQTEEDFEHIEVTVTNETREILGIECVIVRDTVWIDDELVEDTWDWYSQDADGNVWYFGELTLEYEDGELIGIEGSWEAGEDGAQPGIVMPANPQPGDAYRQELLVGEAEDAGEVLSVTETVSVPLGTYNNCVQTADYNPHDPGVVEHKFYAPGVGFIREVKLESGETVELVEIVNP